jgi:hypothetical protein
LTPAGDGTVLDLEHSPVPDEIIANASPEIWGLGSGWEMGMTALGDFLAGKLPEGRATDWVADASPDNLAAAGRLAGQISDAWTAVIAAKKAEKGA